MSSGEFSCTRELSSSSDARTEDRPPTNVNDLATPPPKACTSPPLSRPCLHRSPITTEFGSSHCWTVPAECVFTSTSALLELFAPNYSTTETATSSPPSQHGLCSKPAPISIPAPTLSTRDINRVPTPLSARGDRKGHLFPYNRTPSPRLCSARSCSYQKARSSSNGSEKTLARSEPLSSASAASASSQFGAQSLTMHNESVTFGRYPTSPLSSKPLSTSSAFSPQSPRRGNHGRSSTRNMQINLGRYHPSNFGQVDSPTALGPSVASTSQPSHGSYPRAPAPVQVESPRLLREKHREFIEKARQSSKLAASPFAVKPDAPRLDPLGSPHGVVTPLVLEDAGDYFAVAGAAKPSPVASPDPRNPRLTSAMGDKDPKPSKSRKTDA